MEFYHSLEGVKIAYLDRGTGPPVLLIHGFASHTQMNWINSSWLTTLLEAGYRVISLDNRGHGLSEKLYQSQNYAISLMAGDSFRLLQHLSISRAHVFGYSLGARIAAVLARRHPHHVGRIVFGGMGVNMVRGMPGSGPIFDALCAKSIEEVQNPTARSFRIFAERTNSDLRALAACILPSREPIAPECLKKLEKPVLIAVGDRDELAGNPQGLAEHLPMGQVFQIKRRDHMTAVGDNSFKEKVLDFFSADSAG